VVEAVLGLAEPYRSVLVRRFSEDESVAEIAARLALPEPTVRTRLRRGLEQLRARLRSEMGGTPALFLASLHRLTAESVPAVPLPPVLAGPTTPLLLTLVMKKAVLLTSLAAVALALVWSVTAGGASPPQTPVEALDVVRSPEPLESAEALAATSALAPELEAARTEVVAHAADAEKAVVEAGPPVEADDPIGRVAIRIEDVHGNPIAQARLHATQWRPVEDPGSSIWWGEDGYMGESGPDGVVRLEYTKRHPTSNEGTRTLMSVGYEITHPEFITHTEHGLDVADGDTVVVLERGSFLIVSGWMDWPDRGREAILDVTPHLSYDVDVSAADWIPIGDGRPSCSRIPPGAHELYLSHEASDGRVWYSEVTRFELVEGEQVELALQLLPPRSMTGRLSEDVLRPVTNGEVELNLYVGGRGDASVMLRTYRVDVQSDGSFAFEGLPPGAGEIIGLCDGWVSARERLADSNWIEPETEGERRRWVPLWGLQQLDPAAYAEDPYVLAMEPTGHARITVLDPDGGALAGATVSSWPNIHWSIGYSNIFLDRTWQAVTDDDGVALLENMPGEGLTFLGVTTKEGYLMPLTKDGSDRGVSVELAPGETASLTVRMDQPEDR